MGLKLSSLMNTMFKLMRRSISDLNPLCITSAASLVNVKKTKDIINKVISSRPLQANFGELASFSPIEPLNSFGDIREVVKKRMGTSEILFTVVDLSEDDFGSRANFGRG